MKPRNTKEEIIKVPVDILLDVLTVIVKERLRHEISQVYGNRGIVEISLYLSNDISKHEKVLDNIQNLLEEYNEYRYLQNEELNWKE